MRPKVIFLHPTPVPVHTPLFQRLASVDAFSFEVWFLRQPTRDRKWDEGQQFPYPARVLHGRDIWLGRGVTSPVILNWDVRSELMASDFSVLITSGWDSLAAWVGLLAARKRNKPLILECGSTAYEPSWQRTISLPFVRHFVRQATGFLAYGSRSRDYVISLGAAPDRVRIAYNAADIRQLSEACDALRPDRDRLKAELGVGASRIVLFVGRLIPCKGVTDLLRAMTRVQQGLPDVGLVVVGDGVERPGLERLAVELGVQNVHFAGGHPSHELSRYYAVADCHVLPSLSEPWGLVINEAMACGLPVVATEPVGAGPDLLHEGGNGYVVPARDPPALADAILKVLATPETAAAMGEVSREIIKHFGIEQQAQGFIEAIQMVLER